MLPPPPPRTNKQALGQQPRWPVLPALLALLCATAVGPTMGQTRAPAPSLTATAALAATATTLARDEFLRLNCWDEKRGRWRVLKVAPRNVAAMTDEQLRHEGRQLTRTHHWHQESSTWQVKTALSSSVSQSVSLASASKAAGPLRAR